METDVEILTQIFESHHQIKTHEINKKGMTCICGDCDLVRFSLKEIKEIIEQYGNRYRNINTD